MDTPLDPPAEDVTRLRACLDDPVSASTRSSMRSMPRSGGAWGSDCSSAGRSSRDMTAVFGPSRTTTPRAPRSRFPSRYQSLMDARHYSDAFSAGVPEQKMNKRSLVAVVDDSESVRESLPDLLEQVGFAVQAF